MNADNAHFGKVAVLLGGTAAEREISLISGDAVLSALQRKGVDAHGFDPAETPLSELKAQGFDRAFIVLHGRGGEDGVAQGALETLGLPYTGSGVLGSALGMDKYRCKLIWRGMGLPTPEFALIREQGDLADAAVIGFPLMIKPVHEGSSIGMSRVENEAELEAAWRAAAKFDSLVLAERWIKGVEYTASVLDGEALPLIRLETPHLFYDYNAKYEAEDTRYICPCGLDADKEAALQQLVLQAFEAVGASGWGRVDLFLDDAGDPYLIEVNTVPGMTSHSLVPMAARVAGLEFDELVVRILEGSLARG